MPNTLYNMKDDSNTFDSRRRAIGAILGAYCGNISLGPAH